MNFLFQKLMINATRLTAKGDLKAATAAIQAALAGNSPVSQASPPATPADVLDVVTREVGAPATPEPRAANGRTVRGSHGDALARRDYKLYVPPEAGEAPQPLVVMLHGCTQDADDFAAGTAMNELARTQGFYVLYPEQSTQANPQRCWNWFKHTHQERGRGEPALIAAMAREVMAKHAIDPSRVYVAGLSAGGAMAAILGDTYPDLFAAVGVHSGLAAGAARDLPSAFGAMKGSAQIVLPATPSGVPTIVFHGDADTTVHPGNGGHVITASVRRGAGAETAKGVAAGGRSYTRSLHRLPGEGPVVAEHWVVHGAPHAWSGGSAKGTYTDPAGPDASAEMIRFFLAQRLQPTQ